MTLDEIERLVARLERSDIAEIEVTDGPSRLHLRLSPRTAPAEALAEGASTAEAPALRAPAVGLLRWRHPAQASAPPAAFPREVKAGDIVAFLEAGACLRPVVAEADGTLGAPVVAEGSLVGYGTPLVPLAVSTDPPAPPGGSR